MKVCSKCKLEKSLSEFHKNKHLKDGRQIWCKPCRAQHQEATKATTAKRKKIYREANKEVLAEISKLYYESNKEAITEQAKLYRKANKKKIAKQKKLYYAANKEAVAKTCKLYREANKEVVAEKRRLYYEANKESLNERNRQYYEAHKEADAERSKLYRAANKKHISERSKHYLGRKAMYATHGEMLPNEDGPKIHQDGKTLLVTCKMCGKHYAPTIQSVRNRLSSLEGNMKGEANFYCSDSCKAACPVFWFRTGVQRDPRLPQPDIDPRSCQTDHLKRAQCDENDGQSHCERCGDLVDVETHHNSPIFQYGMEAVSSANHILLCWGCHQKINHATC